MDDTIYHPLRRAFIKPLTTLAFSNIKSENVNDQVLNYSFKDALSEMATEGKKTAKDLRPRGVTNDDVKQFIKDDDFKSREQHYFDYIRKRKMELANKPDEVENLKPKHSPDDYKKLSSTSFNDVFNKYHKGKQNRAVEYYDFNDVMDMVKLVKKPQPKTSVSETKKELEDIKKMPELQDSLANQLITQSQEYKPLDERAEKKRQIEEMQRTQREALEKNKNIDANKIRNIMDAYKGDYKIRDVQRDEFVKLKTLKDQATSDLPPQPISQEKDTKGEEQAESNTDGTEGESK